jgi:hypothetical protein
VSQIDERIVPTSSTKPLMGQDTRTSGRRRIAAAARSAFPDYPLDGGHVRERWDYPDLATSLAQIGTAPRKR